MCLTCKCHRFFLFVRVISHTEEKVLSLLFPCSLSIFSFLFSFPAIFSIMPSRFCNFETPSFSECTNKIDFQFCQLKTFLETILLHYFMKLWNVKIEWSSSGHYVCISSFFNFTWNEAKETWLVTWTMTAMTDLEIHVTMNPTQL